MRRTIILCLLVIFGLSCIASASNLDAPAEKKITVRSEIERGKDAVDRKTGTINLLEFIDGVSEVLHKNKQANTDTEAFCFAVYGQAWIKMHTLIEIYEENKGMQRKRYTASQIQFYHDRAASYYKQFRQKQKELNISDEDLKKLFMFKEEWLQEWNKKIAE